MYTSRNDIINAIREFERKKRAAGAETDKWKELTRADLTKFYKLYVFENQETLDRVVVANYYQDGQDVIVVKRGDWIPKDSLSFPSFLLGGCRDYFVFDIEALQEPNQDRVYFYCGPCTNEGYVDDRNLSLEDKVLKKLFNKQNLELNIAENYHSISFLINSGYFATVEELKIKLIQAGAKEISAN